MSSAPEVAVIVGDYSRRTYVRSALRSLAAQTLARSRFELVVTKNYRDPELDRALERDGATVLFDAEPRIGRWLRHAVKASTAPLVTFLDDDDEAEPERLARVLEVFGRFPELGFYRNRVNVIDAQGQAIPREKWRSHEVDPAFDASGPIYLPPSEKAPLFDLVTRRTHAAFNTSSMALRRELLDGDLGDSFERTQLEDLYLFMVGVLAPKGVYLDDRRLTRYRFYPGNVTHQVGWLRHAEESHLDLVEVARRHGREDFAQWLADQSVHYGRMYRGSSLVERVMGRGDRHDVARRTGDYLRYLGHHPRERALTLDTWAAPLYGIAYLGFPTAVARVARARTAARGFG